VKVNPPTRLDCATVRAILQTGVSPRVTRSKHSTGSLLGTDQPYKWETPAPMHPWSICSSQAPHDPRQNVGGRAWFRQLASARRIRTVHRTKPINPACPPPPTGRPALISPSHDEETGGGERDDARAATKTKPPFGIGAVALGTTENKRIRYGCCDV
jgi:hypothetical protein